MKTYVDVIVPLPIAAHYTYSVPPELEGRIHEGGRVVVQFGAKRYYTAIVVKLHHTPPEAYETKDIFELIDEKPILLKQQYKLWRWIADYYLCTLGDVYKAALPSGMKIESETMVALNEEFESDTPLTPKEQQLLGLLKADEEQCINQLEKQSGLKNLLPTINLLLEKGAVVIKEELKRSYKPKLEARVRLTPQMQNEKMLHIQLDMLSKATKQQAVLMKYLQMSGWTNPGCFLNTVTKSALIEQAQASSAILNELVKKQILEIYFEETGRLTKGDVPTVPLNQLSDAQQRHTPPYSIRSVPRTSACCTV